MIRRRLLECVEMNPGLGAELPSGGGKLEGDKLLESLQVLCVQFNVVVAGSLDPQGLYSTGTALVHGQAMGEVDHLVLRTMDHQHWGRHLGHLVNTMEGKETKEIKGKYNSPTALTCDSGLSECVRPL